MDGAANRVARLIAAALAVMRLSKKAVIAFEYKIVRSNFILYYVVPVFIFESS